MVSSDQVHSITVNNNDGSDDKVEWWYSNSTYKISNRKGYNQSHQLFPNKQ